MLQKRLVDALDKSIQPTQCRFRPRRCTTHAVHYISRVMEKGANSNRTPLPVLLDREKGQSTRKSKTN